MQNSKAIKSILLILTLLITTSCATKGYQGPELPDNETALVYFFSRGIDPNNMKIDQIDQGFFDMGIKVLPGEHNAVIDFEIKSEDCSYGYDYCTEYTFPGYCRATLNTEAGHQYNIEIFGVTDSATISVQDKNGEVAGSGECNVSPPRRDYIYK